MLAPLLWATAPVVAQRELPPMKVRSGTLSFDARATLGDFTGTTDSVAGEMTGGQLEQVRGWVEAPAGSLQTGNRKRDADLRKSMETDQHPALRFELDSSTTREVGEDSAQVDLHGRLTLHGVTRAVKLPARLSYGDGALRLRSDFPLNVKDYEVGGLSKLLGMLKMHEGIVVHVDLLFGADAGAAAPP